MIEKEIHFLGSTYIKEKVKSRVDELPNSSTIKVTIEEQKNKSSRCRGLQWLWNTEVANSGMGSHDTKEDVHRASKWRWAVPILIRDDEDFAEIWPELLTIYKTNSEKMKYIVDEFVSTEGTGFAIGEYLTDFEQYYRSHGVPMTQPDDGLLEWANEHIKKGAK